MEKISLEVLSIYLETPRTFKNPPESAEAAFATTLQGT
jgi:hypothetical protein